MGFLVGPVAGSVFYKIGGYTLPFIVFGSLSLILVPIVGYYIKNTKKKVLLLYEETTRDNLITSISKDLKVSQIDVRTFNY